MKFQIRFPKAKGFTLIELIMTIVVVGIVAIPLSLLLSQHIESTFQSEDLTIALNLARFEMEKVNNLAYDDIGNANYPTYEGYDYQVQRNTQLIEGNPSTPESLNRIRVEVKDTDTGAVIVTLITYIAKNVGYGV